LSGTQEKAGRALVIGYGNPYRRDDGVALHVMNMVRERLGILPLPPDASGEDDLGHAVDTVMAHQLLPEMAALLAGYDRVVFIDAHAGGIPETVRVLPVSEEQGFQAVVHHMTPGHLLHYARLHAGCTPQGWLVSVRGYDFDFGETLSEACAMNAQEALKEVMRLIATG
jgi:hydrogenase maturation protease